MCANIQPYLSGSFVVEHSAIAIAIICFEAVGQKKSFLGITLPNVNRFE